MFSHDIVIVGGGAAGISVAASLLRHRPGHAMLKGHEWLAAPKPLQNDGR